MKTTRNKLIIILALMLCVTMTFTLTYSPIFAEESDRSEEDVQEDIDEKQDKLEEGQQESEKLQEKMDSVQGDIDDTEAKIEIVNGDIANLQAEINDNQQELDAKRKEMKEGIDNLNVRLRTMYKNGTVGFVDVLLSSESFDELVSNIDMVRRIYSSDKDLVKELQKEYKQIEKARDDLQAKREEMNGKMAELASLNNDLKGSYEELKATKKEIDKNNEELEGEIDELEEELEEIRASAAAAAQEPGGNMPSYSGDGSLIWPCSGTISSYFGYRWGTLHHGLDIATPIGTPVVAAGSGTVIMAQYYYGYGNYVQINHGNGLVTGYGHLDSFNCSVGQTVNQGDLIALSGNTGHSTGPHCHFEVLVNGEFVDPLSFL